MFDDFDMNIQCEEYFDSIDEYAEYYGLEWSDRFEEALDYEED